MSGIEHKKEKGNNMKLDDFLKRAENLQLEEKGRTLPIMQIAIMFETWSAGDSTLMSNITKKYEVPRYTVSRNCKMLGDGILDNNVTKGKRMGKNWISVKKEGRSRHINFTVAGKKIADRLFA